MTRPDDSSKPAKCVQITLELPEAFIRLLHSTAQLRGYYKWKGHDLPPKLTPADLIAWLVLLEARGETEEGIHAATPLEWRDAESPKVIHSERKVYEGAKCVGKGK